MNAAPRYSVIVPVFNRPEEMGELLESLRTQPYRDFEVIIVEDGSKIRCDHLPERFVGEFPIRYEYVSNAGPGPARNHGVTMSAGRYILFFDSDCLVPAGFFAAVEAFLAGRSDGGDEPKMAWGGPDAGHSSFTPLQQAMAYTMSSVLTTGGIRGGRAARSVFQPRSFNMGMHREVFIAAGGFLFDRSAEDIELSLRIRGLGYPVELIEDAFVWHKRRTTLAQFYSQVFRFAEGRVLVSRRHPGNLKIVHLFPLAFTLGWMSLSLWWWLWPVAGSGLTALYLLYLSAVSIGSWIRTHSLHVALLSVPSVLVQFTGYGLGMLTSLVRR